MATIKATIDEAEMKRIDAQLVRIPLFLREKTLRKAVRRAVVVMAKEARATATEQPDFDTASTPLKDSIKLTAKVDGAEVVGTAFVAGQAAAYAQSVEYGHAMFLWGVPTAERVDPSPAPNGFWRRSIDTTRGSQHNEIVRTLETDIGKLARA